MCREAGLGNSRSPAHTTGRSRGFAGRVGGSPALPAPVFQQVPQLAQPSVAVRSLDARAAHILEPLAFRLSKLIYC